MSKQELSIAQQLNNSVASVLTNTQVEGFEKAFLVSSAIEQLKALLTSQYMKPIMAMQGNKLGFKTDKDKDGGYPETVVKNCLIEAVLMGLQPTGNQFNIIAGNTYATKEGVGELLKKIPGLNYNLSPELPRINPEKTSAAIEMNIEWTIGGKKSEKTIKIPVKMNSAMGTDAVIGKAIRKARKWLFDTITGSELPEGDAEDTTFEYVEEPLAIEKGDKKKADLKAKKESESKDPETVEGTSDPKDEVKTEVKPSGLQMP